MSLGVEVPPLPRNPSRALGRIASAIWLAVAVPFAYAASLYWAWPAGVFADWRGWVFTCASVVCVLMATVVPRPYRVAICGTRLHGWGRNV